MANWLIVSSDSICRATSSEERHGYFRYAQLRYKMVVVPCDIGLVLIRVIGAMSTTLPMAAVSLPLCRKVLSHDANDANGN